MDRRQLKGENFYANYNPPPEFDLNYYLHSLSDANIAFDKTKSEEYFKQYALDRGHSTCNYDRGEHLRKFLQDTIDEQGLKTLEISPWDRPALGGKNVKYFDAADAETLRKSAADASRHANRVPSKIDFISPTGDLGVVDEKFDIVFSSHVIEHCPDLVEHFNSVSKILNAGGLYVMLVPDKRYCFDYYHSESTISEIIDAAVSKRKIPRLADVINLGLTRTHNSAALHWRGNHGERYGYRKTPLAADLNVKVLDEYFADNGEDNRREKLLRLIEKYSEAVKRGEYISTHNWRFTPESFRYIIHMLNDLKFIDLPLYRCCNTVWRRQEFVAMLEKK